MGARGASTPSSAAGGEAVRLPGGEFVDVPVAERARRVLALAESVTAR